ncbi:MAG: HAMP domain-containing sensor histidine kinase [Candidatus Vogelbacteria bacterium]|nr:HAMP domain-containing sensor histidine kinase [Candidatus Vogelbacteria bacterium]
MPDLSAFNNPIVWLVVGAFFTLAFVGGYFRRGRKADASNLKLLIEEANLKTEQIAELQVVNRQMEESNRELHAKELELTMANKKLQSLETAKSKFISVTTHQLRTPLAAIKWTFDMAAKGQLGPVNDEQIKFLNKGLESSDRVIAIVNDLLKIDAIESERSDYVYRATDIVKLIDSVFFEFTNQVASKKIAFSFEKPERNLPLIEIDANKIRMVVENLVDNATKYTPKDGEITIKIDDERVNSADGSIKISVLDTGIGIPEDEKDKMFHKFFRASNAIQMEPDGSGVGLYIVRDIVEKHGGAIWFVNRQPNGTEFSFTLPLHQKKV